MITNKKYITVIKKLQEFFGKYNITLFYPFSQTGNTYSSVFGIDALKNEKVSMYSLGQNYLCLGSFYITFDLSTQKTLLDIRFDLTAIFQYIMYPLVIKKIPDISEQYRVLYFHGSRNSFATQRYSDNDKMLGDLLYFLEDISHMRSDFDDAIMDQKINDFLLKVLAVEVEDEKCIVLNFVYPIKLLEFFREKMKEIYNRIKE